MKIRFVRDYDEHIFCFIIFLLLKLYPSIDIISNLVPNNKYDLWSNEFERKNNHVITIVRYFAIGMKAMLVIFIYLFICKDDTFLYLVNDYFYSLLTNWAESCFEKIIYV
jgi:hypothetical protein